MVEGFVFSGSRHLNTSCVCVVPVAIAWGLIYASTQGSLRPPPNYETAPRLVWYGNENDLSQSAGKPKSKVLSLKS